MFFLADMLNRKLKMPSPAEALPGRQEPVAAGDHAVSGRTLAGPFPQGAESVCFAMGPFASAERLFWPVEGVWVTAAGYAGGFTPDPTFQEVTTGLTGHAQAVRIVFEPARLTFGDLLALFWENHDPTQGMRQGGDIGTAYRSAIFTNDAQQREAALASRDIYAAALKEAGGGAVTTEIAPLAAFYFAEAEHQQYLVKNPTGRAETKGTGVRYPRKDEPNAAAARGFSNR
jgi:peptide-methionine (S)-S-oxide reductase